MAACRAPAVSPARFHWIARVRSRAAPRIALSCCERSRVVTRAIHPAWTCLFPITSRRCSKRTSEVESRFLAGWASFIRRSHRRLGRLSTCWRNPLAGSGRWSLACLRLATRWRMSCPRSRRRRYTATGCASAGASIRRASFRGQSRGCMSRRHGTWSRCRCGRRSHRSSSTRVSPMWTSWCARQCRSPCPPVRRLMSSVRARCSGWSRPSRR